MRAAAVIVLVVGAFLPRLAAAQDAGAEASATVSAEVTFAVQA